MPARTKQMQSIPSKQDVFNFPPLIFSLLQHYIQSRSTTIMPMSSCGEAVPWPIYPDHFLQFSFPILQLPRSNHVSRQTLHLKVYARVSRCWNFDGCKSQIVMFPSYSSTFMANVERNWSWEIRPSDRLAAELPFRISAEEIAWSNFSLVEGCIWCVVVG